MDPTMNIEQMK